MWTPPVVVISNWYPALLPPGSCIPLQEATLTSGFWTIAPSGRYPSNYHNGSCSGACDSATVVTEIPDCRIGCPGRSETSRLMDNPAADRPSPVLWLPILHQVCQTSPSPQPGGYEGQVPQPDNRKNRKWEHRKRSRPGGWGLALLIGRSARTCELVRHQESRSLFQNVLFTFEPVDAGHQGSIHATKFGAPLVEGGGADAMFVAELWDEWTDLCLVEDGYELGIAKAWCFHVEPPTFKIRKNYTYDHPSFSGGLPPFRVSSSRSHRLAVVRQAWDAWR